MSNSHVQELFADGLVTVKEAARLTQLSKSTIYNLMERGELGFVKIGRSRRIPAAALLQLLESHYIKPRR